VFWRARDKDYYAILQVDPRAEPEVIEAAYRRLSRKYHPDVDGRPGAGHRMAELNEAYEVLSDPGRRAAYDLRRSVAPGPGPAPPFSPIRDLLRQLLPYLAVVLLAPLVIRFLPFLLRPPVLAVLVAGVILYYFFLRRPSRH
jgi:hypothetical protein